TGFSSESDFEDYIRSTVNSRNVLAAIVKYYLRFSSVKKNINAGAYLQEHSWFTKFLFPPGHLEKPRNLLDADGGSPGYISEGFLAVQHALDKAIMLHHGGAAAKALFNDISLFIQRFPTPAFHYNLFYKLANIFIPLTVACTFFMNYITLVQSVVWEKENQLKRSYWFGDTPQTNPEITQFHETIQSKYFEAEPADLIPGIRIKHLHKVFKKSNTIKVAIEDLSLNLYEGQISVLLGHNGAGKSTTLAILSGLYPPTRGEAYVYGYDISQNMAQIRKSLGLCPQHNLLFDHLTVSEHLYFYCRVKGVPQKVCLEETNNMLSAFNLLEKRDEFSKSLSGGMKRKLAVIIALIGGSKVVILDEPTSGMDPASRRTIWDLLQAYKHDRTILLTTHYMDEADVLGDRIAIMVQGTLQCCGSSVFLKRLYGIGYHVVMVKEPHCDTDEISKLIHGYASTATLKTNVGNELSFILPQEYTQKFEALFTALEENQERLGISSFGVSITTMEEVFFRVSNMEDSKSDIQATQSPSVGSKENKNEGVPSTMIGGFPTHSEDPTIVFNTGVRTFAKKQCSLYRQQFHAMFIKRLIYNWRNWRVLLVQILGLVISALFLLKPHDLSNEDEKTRQMNLDEYGQTIVPFSVSGKSNLTTSLLTQLENMLKPGNHKLKEVQGDLLKYLEGSEECIHLCIIALSMEVVENRTELTVLFNNEAYHSPSLSLAVLDNILFMSLSGADASITVSNKPQPHPQAKKSLGSIEGKVVALKIQLGMALLVSGFCLLTVTERSTKAKHMQFLSGVSVLVYWLSALMLDFIIFFISCCLLLVVFKYCKIDIYVTDYHVLETMLILTLFGWSAIPLTYLMSFLFSKSTSAYIKLTMFNYVSGIFSILIDTVIVAQIPATMSNTTKTFLLNALLLFPTYNLGKCIGDYTVIYQRKIQCTQQKNVPKYLNCSKE
ncbi:hypothetical protein A6R68_19880, partial [Neotoma lepida]